MKIKNSARELAHNNTGSAIITVVVAMLFIIALGAALLFSAYTAYRISAVEQQDKKTFYMADSAMDDIKVGLQTEATKALASAYTQVLKEYSTAEDPNFDPQKALAQAFKSRFLQSAIAMNNAEEKLFYTHVYGQTETVYYKPITLESYILAPYGASAIVGSADSFAATQDFSGDVVLTKDGSGTITAITLKAVSLKYSANDYESHISADITIAVPDFYAMPILTGGVSSYTIVADGGLVKSSGGTSTVHGKVFAGGVTVSGTGNALSFTGGDLVSAGPISVTSGGLFFNAENNELWAKSISMNSNGALITNGRVYVANDLMLGTGGKAELNGSYFGFGSEDANSDPNKNMPDKSSAILVNGKGATLDISKLKRLSLAGVSFIDISSGGLQGENEVSYAAPIPMGESLSIKSNQLAYLVPVECIQNYASNPMVFNGTAVDAPDCNTDSVLWKIGDQEKTLAYYINNGKGEIKALYKNVDGNNIKLAYVFFLFKNQKYANEYFRDYFQVYPERISQYMEFYLSLSDKGTDTEISTAGNSFYMDKKNTTQASDDVLTLVPATAAIWSSGLQNRFNGMKSPYESFVNVQAIQNLSSGDVLTFVKDGKPVAVVAKDSYSHIAGNSDIRLIVSGANVSVSGSYEGTVITKGRLELGGSISGKPFDNSMLSAVCNYKNKVYLLSDFVNSGISSAVEDGNAWAPEKLVYYENWTKN